MAMIKDINEKSKRVIEQLEQDYSKDKFIDLFIQKYPEDWNLVVDRYKQHVRKSKGKPHPMAKPRQYILNISYHVRNRKSGQFVKC